jgi:hypothetical protein
MDNKEDLKFLTSSNGLNDIINVHIKGLDNYYDKYFKN